MNGESDAAPASAMFTLEQRIAISELFYLTGLLTDADKANPRTQALAALALERAADIIRGEAEPICMSDHDILHFAQAWQDDEHALFNMRAPRRHGNHPPRRRQS